MNPKEVSVKAIAEANASDEEADQPLDLIQWYGRIYALCQSMLISRADAEDAVQEAFHRALAKPERTRGVDNVSAWLRRVARNVCVDMIRRNQVRKSTTHAVDELPSSDSNQPDGAPREDVARLIAELPEPMREVILLHYYEDMTYDQMASWLGVARSTVNDRLSRAREKLRLQLIEKGSVDA